MYRLFGETVVCRFVDIKDDEAEAYPHLTARRDAGSLRLPAVLINGAIRYEGVFSPTFIQRDLSKLLGEPGSRERAGERTAGGGRVPAGEYLRRAFANSVVQGGGQMGFSRVTRSTARGTRGAPGTRGG